MGHTVKMVVVVALLLHTENDHVCTTVLSKKKIRLFYLSSLLNGEERDYSPLVTGAVSTYTVCATVLSMIKILFFYLFSLLNREERDYSSRRWRSIHECYHI